MKKKYKNLFQEKSKTPKYVLHTKKKVKSLSCVQLFVTLWTLACQVPPSMGFPRQESRVVCHFLLQGIFQTQGLNPSLPHCRQTLYRLNQQGNPMSYMHRALFLNNTP